MLHALLTLALAPLVLGVDTALPAGTQLSYRGTLAATESAAGDAGKTFDLTLWVLSTNEAGTDLFWLVDERGQGEFPWPARFGRTQLDAQYRTSSQGPAVLLDRGEDQTVVSIAWPLLAPAVALESGATFVDGDLEYTVEKSLQRGEGPAWRITARNGFGPKRNVVIEADGPLLLESEERLTVGRGESYRLQLELVERGQLTEPELAAFTKTAVALLGLRDKLNVPARAERIAWRPEQAEYLLKELPTVVQLTAGTPLAGLTNIAKRDLELQIGRNDAVATTQARFVGRTVEPFSLRGTAGEKLQADDLKDQITVLHFWDYRDEPLREPYGQVGYLDFLYHRHQAAGLRVLGVAVNPRLGDEATRGAATASARKLKSFMNLSYPVLLDEGTLLRQFGDPRVVGASLPLFVVIGPAGTILHYHVGPYEVQHDQGLKELDAVVTELLGQRK